MQNKNGEKTPIKVAFLYLRSKGIVHTQKDVGEAMGVGKENISRAFNGNEDYLTPSFVARFNKAFGDIFNEDYLLGKGGDMLNGNAMPVLPYIQENLVYVDYVPVSATASFVESLYDNAYISDKYGVMPEADEVLGGDDIVFQVEGESMYPTIPDGAKILAKRIPEGMWESASGVVVVVYNKTLTVKRILKNGLFTDNMLTLKADNPMHGQVDVSRSEIRGMWKAVRIVSQKIL